MFTLKCKHLNRGGGETQALKILASSNRDKNLLALVFLLPCEKMKHFVIFETLINKMRPVCNEPQEQGKMGCPIMDKLTIENICGFCKKLS